MKLAFASLVGAAWLLAAAPAVSHHAFAAEFDMNQPIQLLSVGEGHFRFVLATRKDSPTARSSSS